MNSSIILLIGNCIVDQIWQLEHFPAQDEEMRALAKTRVMGGNACNSARVLAMLGDQVELVSSLAQDAWGDWLLQQLSAQGISTQYCRQLTGFSTPESSIWLSRANGSRTIVHHRNLPELTLTELRQIPVENYQWIHLEGRNIETLATYLTELGGFNGRISLEIEKNRAGIESLLALVDVVIVSSAYLKSTGQTAEQCMTVFQRYNPALDVVCTLGEQGLIACDSASRMTRIEAEPVDRVVDTIGAGDCFIAGLIQQMVGQHDFHSALQVANRLAAKKIQHEGLVF